MKQYDRIHLRDYLREAEIGAFSEERDRLQRLRFNIIAELAISVAEAGDDVDKILSYDVLVGAIEQALTSRRHDLVESLAEEIAQRILAEPLARRVEVTVEKLDRGPGALGVTLARERQGSSDRRGLDVETVLESDLPVAKTVVIVPSAPDLPLPQGGDRLRMLWLALDQQALSLAARLDLPVVDSKTEMTALFAAGQSVVWAPSRMARAAIGLETAEPQDLAEWLKLELSNS